MRQALRGKGPAGRLDAKGCNGWSQAIAGLASRAKDRSADSVLR